MSTGVVVVTALIAALGAASAAGVLVNRRSGALRETAPGLPQDTADLGLSEVGPTVVHFTAAWCGPCASVRRVVEQVCTDLPDVAHLELDIDAHPAAAKRLSVLSLPTTFIFDAGGRQRYRSAGVPKAAELRQALQPLLA
ncbi:thioredoxin family protein [Mycobacterium paraseoulense]|uniref:Thiol reductase thioredoxin n=1 Tax=Mycobacterium paraseoulense TaxID=590652 RepID=A0A1X0IGD3_9MYCO|nr:thioredoxin family protein [Mycobacterium paraseoulense]MCV7396058.1 thioredoxin family protein [Mycobacterium paraseoulense]ORB45849.1 thiol reductase thioredoxin [Mycobacterium paraseoulense]BBZ70836.1 thiol reductase thioredoxin [Mycobacterium paraseoulense]